MKMKLLIIVLFLIFVNINLIIALEPNSELDMNQIIEIDNAWSKDKARNTSNPNVKEVEQNNPIYFHYIKKCQITDIDYMDLGRRKASYEFYTHDDFKKNKNTLLITPFVERDFPIKFDCTQEILTIKSLSPSKFNEVEPVTLSKITTVIEGNEKTDSSLIENSSTPDIGEEPIKTKDNTPIDEENNILKLFFFRIVPISWILYEVFIGIVNRRKKSKKIPHLFTVIARFLDSIKERKSNPEKNPRDKQKNKDKKG